MEHGLQNHSKDYALLMEDKMAVGVLRGAINYCNISETAPFTILIALKR